MPVTAAPGPEPPRFDPFCRISLAAPSGPNGQRASHNRQPPMFTIAQNRITPALKELARRAATLPQQVRVPATPPAYARIASLGQPIQAPSALASLGFRTFPPPPVSATEPRPSPQALQEVAEKITRHLGL